MCFCFVGIPVEQVHINPSFAPVGAWSFIHGVLPVVGAVSLLVVLAALLWNCKNFALKGLNGDGMMSGYSFPRYLTTVHRQWCICRLFGSGLCSLPGNFSGKRNDFTRMTATAIQPPAAIRAIRLLAVAMIAFMVVSIAFTAVFAETAAALAAVRAACTAL